jgi:hypothetical protein
LKDQLKSIPDSQIPSRQARILAGISGGQGGSRANFGSSHTESTGDAGAADPEALKMLNELRHMSNDITLSPDNLQLQIPKIQFDRSVAGLLEEQSPISDLIEGIKSLSVR